MITIDIDTKNQVRALSTYYNLCKLGYCVEVKETKHGYHFIVRGVKHDLRLREIMGDDPYRILMDEIRPKYTQNVLWTCKHGFIPQTTNLLSLPFCSKVPRSHFISKKRK